MQLREVRSEDLDRFFEHQQDPEANQMAAFAPRNPQDRGVFDYHWSRLLNDPDTQVWTIEEDGRVAGALIVSGIGSVPELSFWTAREFWGQGITTSAVGIAAALIHTIAHALFKSGLFMVVGVVDHATGTRDLRRLPVLYRALPFTFVVTVLGAGAMGDLSGVSGHQLVVLPGTAHFIPPGSGVLDRAEWLLAMIPPFLDAPGPKR